MINAHIGPVERIRRMVQVAQLKRRKVVVAGSPTSIADRRDVSRPVLLQELAYLVSLLLVHVKQITVWGGPGAERRA